MKFYNTTILNQSKNFQQKSDQANNVLKYIQPWWLGVIIRQLSHSVDRCHNVHGGFESAWKQLRRRSE